MHTRKDPLLEKTLLNRGAEEERSTLWCCSSRSQGESGLERPVANMNSPSQVFRDGLACRTGVDGEPIDGDEEVEEADS